MSQIFLPGEILAMSGQAADRLLKLDSGDAALLYLQLLRRGNLEGLRWPEDRARSALELLRARGWPRAPSPSRLPPSRRSPPRTTPPRTSAGRWRTGAPPSPPWPMRWSGGWASGCPPPT